MSANPTHFTPIERDRPQCQVVTKGYWYSAPHQCSQTARWKAPDGTLVCGQHRRQILRNANARPT